MIYINSTLRAERARSGGRPISPIHYWSYVPDELDVSITHSTTREAIIIRSRLRSWDPGVLAKVFRNIAKHNGEMYLVTQPDCIGMFPLLARLFKKTRFVTWAWTPDEVEKWKQSYTTCSRVLCLTDVAVKRAQSLLQNSKVSLGLWEVCPDFYDPRGFVNTLNSDIALVGRTRRAVVETQEFLERSLYTVSGTPAAHSAFGGKVTFTTCLEDVQEVFRTSAASLVFNAGPTFEPLGYTNLVEALALGCPVIIPEDSAIPASVLSLYGVYTFDRNCQESLREASAEAVSLGRSFRARIQIRDHCLSLLGVGSTAKLLKDEFKK